jgi:hypothetical protein
MLSLTANAPAESFNDPAEFFEGKGVDDLMFPMHMNFKFFDMTPMPTFMAYDVMKNAECVFRSIRTAIPASFGQAFRCRPDKLILTSHDFLFT